MAEPAKRSSKSLSAPAPAQSAPSHSPPFDSVSAVPSPSPDADPELDPSESPSVSASFAVSHSSYSPHGDSLSSPYSLPFAAFSSLGGIKSSDFNNALIHLYRGELGRQVAYRTRLDTSTNYALSTLAGLTILSIGSDLIPHYFHLVIAFFLVLFCAIESRRYGYYSIIQYRVRQLEKGFYGQFILGPERLPDGSVKSIGDSEGEIDIEDRTEWLHRLQDSLFYPRHVRPFAYYFIVRLQRIYYYLLLGAYVGWILKLQVARQWDDYPSFLAVSAALIVLALFLYVIYPRQQRARHSHPAIPGGFAASDSSHPFHRVNSEEPNDPHRGEHSLRNLHPSGQAPQRRSSKQNNQPTWAIDLPAQFANQAGQHASGSAGRTHAPALLQTPGRVNRHKKIEEEIDV